MRDDGEWWRQPWELVSELRRRASEPVASACYRFGDALLEIDSDYGPLLDGLSRWYGECAVPGPTESGSRIYCSVRCTDDPFLIWISFRRPDDPESEVAALRVFHHLYRAKYSVLDSRAPGWRVMYGSKGATRPFFATSGFDALFDVREEPPGLPPGFLLSYLLSAVTGLQRDVLFVHAASVGIHGTAALLMGHGGAGKTTLSLTLAARGHAFLGDNQACIRIKSREVLRFPRSAAIKPGPRAQAVTDSLRETPHDTVRMPDGRVVALMRVGSSFPSPKVGPLSLGSFFYLRRIADRPVLERFKPAMTDRAFLGKLAADPMAVFGVSPSRRLMNVMVLMEILSEVPCFFLDAGGPEETAELVERTMEGL